MTQSQAHNKNVVDPLIGREVKDYRFSSKLGGGAFGAVYKADHIRLSGRSVAIKVLHPHIASDESIVERFRREARSLSGLNHPNIVQIIDFDWHDDIGFYLVLELLVGDALNRVLKLEKRLSLDTVVNLFTHLLSALQEAHNQGIVHRDLKPANLMIVDSVPQRVLKILDFGIASLNDSEHELTTDGTAMGSANYMSPEQALGQIKKIDVRSDLYSCGIIMGKCLTGKNVYAADSPTQILWKHIYEPPPLLKSLYPAGNFSQALEDVFAKSIAKEKDARFQSAHDFLHALQAAVAETSAQLLVEDDFIDDADETIFDASYTNNLMARAAELSMPTPPAAPQAPPAPPTPAVATPIVAATARPVTGNMAALARPATGSSASFQSSGPVVTTAGNVSAIAPLRASAARSISDLNLTERAPIATTPSSSSIGMSETAIRPVQIRDRTRTGIVRPPARQEPVPDLAGESSASFSAPRFDRPTPRRRTQGAIRSPMRQGGSLWDDYKWWIIGGCVGALVLVLTALAFFAVSKNNSQPAHRHIDARQVDPDITWDSIGKEIKKEGKPNKRK